MALKNLGAAPVILVSILHMVGGNGYGKGGAGMTFSPGMEQELFANSTPEERAKWKARELIGGDWDGDGSEGSESTEDPAELRRALDEAERFIGIGETNYQHQADELKGVKDELERTKMSLDDSDKVLKERDDSLKAKTEENVKLKAEIEKLTKELAEAKKPKTPAPAAPATPASTPSTPANPA